MSPLSVSRVLPYLILLERGELSPLSGVTNNNNNNDNNSGDLYSTLTKLSTKRLTVAT